MFYRQILPYKLRHFKYEKSKKAEFISYETFQTFSDSVLIEELNNKLPENFVVSFITNVSNISGDDRLIKVSLDHKDRTNRYINERDMDDFNERMMLIFLAKDDIH